MIYYKILDIPKEKQHEEAYKLLLHGLHKEYDMKELPVIAKGEHGKPYFPDEEIYFNVSHTDGAVACMISEYPCGIDIQSIAKSIRAAKKVCSVKEQEQLACAKEPERLFTRYWALKEAFVKCTGTGITDELLKVDFSECIENDFMHDNMHFAVEEEEQFILATCNCVKTSKKV
ncbi:MAG: 4'-phosphopantetheinyl transferase superfamily protein [Lachnospiraceae bacterium]|nr:4'-phosphopantetheinyl transferase superfamily protein [Lachnospiraceae bacterium]